MWNECITRLPDNKTADSLWYIDHDEGAYLVCLDSTCHSPANGSTVVNARVFMYSLVYENLELTCKSFSSATLTSPFDVRIARSIIAVFRLGNMPCKVWRAVVSFVFGTETVACSRSAFCSGCIGNFLSAHHTRSDSTVFLRFSIDVKVFSWSPKSESHDSAFVLRFRPDVLGGAA